MIVHGRDQRLDHKDIRLAAVLVELDLKAAVAEPANPGRAQRQAELGADALGQIGMRAAGKDDDPSHVNLSPPANQSTGCGIRGKGPRQRDGSREDRPRAS